MLLIIQKDSKFKEMAEFADGLESMPCREKYLRVILLQDAETVHNAFFDRGYKS